MRFLNVILCAQQNPHKLLLKEYHPRREKQVVCFLIVEPFGPLRSIAPF